MRNDVESEILFHIEAELSDRDVDHKQLLNHIRENSDGYVLWVYGNCLRFNKDGDLL